MRLFAKKRSAFLAMGLAAVVGIGGWGLLRSPMAARLTFGGQRPFAYRSPEGTTARILYGAPRDFTDAALLREAQGGNGYAVQTLLLRRSPLLAQAAESPVLLDRGIVHVPFDVARDAALRPLSADDLERLARPGGQYKDVKTDGIGYEAQWYGGAIAHLWRLDPARGERLAREAMRHRPTDWDGLQKVAWLGPETLTTFGAIYVRAHASEQDPVDALIGQLPRLTHGEIPTYLHEPGPQDARVEYPRYGGRVLVDWHPGRPSPRDPAEGAKTSAEYARRLEAFLAREPRTTVDAAAWRDVAMTLPFVLHRDPVRALRIALASGGTQFGNRFFIADRIARDLDRVPPAQRPALAAFVRAHPESFRATLLGFLYVPSVRAAYERELALPYATEWTVDLVGIWSRLTPAHRERLLDLAQDSRHMQGAHLAVALLNRAPHDARLRPFAEWALRTPASHYHGSVLLTLAANGDPAALARLRTFAGASNPVLAEDATSALTDSRLDAVTAPLLRHPAPWVRYQGAIRLGFRQDEPGRARLRSLLRDPFALVRHEAASRLGIPSPPAPISASEPASSLAEKERRPRDSV